jgi:group I intron endonuclease
MKIGVVYTIVNTINGKRYIGSTTNFTKRKNTHLNFLKRNKHHSTHLQRSFNTHGEEHFLFEIITECFECELRKTEQFYIEFFKPEYNVSKSTIAPMQGRKHSQKTLLKMKGRRGPTGKRKPWSEETRQKQLKSRIGKKRSQEFKDRRSKEAIADGRAKYIAGVNNKKIKSSENIIFNSLTEASKYYKISPQAICDNLKGRTNATRKGIRFEYVS